MRSIDHHHLARPLQLNRKLLSMMGDQFPVINERTHDCTKHEELPGLAADRPYRDPLMALVHVAQAGWRPDAGDQGESPGKAAPVLLCPGLPREEAARLAKWTRPALQQAIDDETTYFSIGLHGSKRDVGAGLDPGQRGLVSEHRIKQLFQA